MVKSYKDYCREAVARDPKLYGNSFNIDGSRKPLPNIASLRKNKTLQNLPKHELDKIRRENFNPFLHKRKEPKIEISRTRIKVKRREANSTIIEMPKSPSRREYNRIWMSNKRAKQHIKELKENGTTTTL